MSFNHIKIKKILFNLEKCDACGECLGLCDALSIYNFGFVNHEKCDACWKCIDVCDTEALVRS